MNIAFLSINEVAKQLDLPAHTLRYWEKQFPASIKPATGAGGRRYYRPETISALKRIKTLLYDHGMTIAGVKKLIKDGQFINTDITTSSENSIDSKLSKSSESFIPSNTDIDKTIDLLEQARAILNP
ncbi:MAG: MerR family transcriptional regulator [Alphaproteobacteria bacterium]|jgi:DNA-binding transcriptional MerR regulator|nr:MerR family transcriptional regulator [Alphaproteobacteria bacterium]